MNPITFNEIFEHIMFKSTQQGGADDKWKMFPFPTGSQTISGQSERIINDWRVSPLFDYVTTREKERSLVKELSLPASELLEMRLWPFETFRLSMVETAQSMWEERGIVVGKGRYRLDALVTRYDKSIYILGHVKEMFDEKPELRGSLGLRPMVFYIHELRAVDEFAAPHDQYQCRLAVFAKDGWYNVPNGNTYLKETWQGVVDSVSGFILDAMMPTNHIVQVRPVDDENRRSVEWVKARTHYTLITHGHPANRPEIKHGERVQSDHEGELKRMAHARKAHKRTLRSERFRYMRGQTINVKAAWIGPKEWRDQGGKQIYRILEEVT
jgi:hypothetical protein